MGCAASFSTPPARVGGELVHQPGNTPELEVAAYGFGGQPAIELAHYHAVERTAFYGNCHDFYR